MTEDDSVSEWIARLKQDVDKAAAQKLFDRYADRLAAIAKSRLAPGRHRIVDEEDLVAEAMASLFQGMRAGRFPDLNDRNDLWSLLLVLIDRRMIDEHRRQSAQKRGGGAASEDSLCEAFASNVSPGSNICGIADSEPSPDIVAEMNDELGLRLKSLKDRALQQIAVLRMQGFTNDEIAQQLGCSTRTVERQLAEIRKAWLEG